MRHFASLGMPLDAPAPKPNFWLSLQPVCVCVCVCVWQVIQTDGRASKLSYDPSTDHVWIQQTVDGNRRRQRQKNRADGNDVADDGDDDDADEVVVIREASEDMLHRVVHVDAHHHGNDDDQLDQQLEHDEHRLLDVRRLHTTRYSVIFWRITHNNEAFFIPRAQTQLLGHPYNLTLSKQRRSSSVMRTVRPLVVGQLT